MRLGDLVPMPLPTQWGPTVIPPGAAGPQSAQLGWCNVGNGWVLGYRFPNGQCVPMPGAPVQSSPNGTSPQTAAYLQNLGLQPSGLTPGVPAPVSGSPSVGVPPPQTTAPASWGRQSILPDSALPPTLQRNNPLVAQFVPLRPNGWDAQIRRHADVWSYIASHGGLKSCCRLPELGAPIYDSPPWITMPSQGEKFEEMFGQPITAFQTDGAFNGLDVVLGQFVVPNGYDGAINRFVTQFTGTGFQAFQGQIFWRLLINNRYARNLGNVQNTFGSFEAAFSVPGTDNLRLVSQQTITLLASIPAGSPVADGYVAAGCFGWFYPRR